MSSNLSQCSIYEWVVSHAENKALTRLANKIETFDKSTRSLADFGAINLDALTRMPGIGTGKTVKALHSIRERIEIGRKPDSPFLSEYIYGVGIRRYEGMLNRSFKNFISYLWFENVFLVEETRNLLECVETFLVRDELKQRYAKLYVDMTKVRERNSAFETWENANKELYIEIENKFQQRFEKDISREYFCRDFFGLDNSQDRKCYYCGIPEPEILRLSRTKRLYKRFRMDVDRIDSSGEYKKENIVLACPPCNNAKTDEFTQDEFRPIAEAIKAIWDQRRNALQISSGKKAA